MPLTFAVDIGKANANQDDINGGFTQVEQENKRRIDAAAAQDPPVEPELLPTSPNAALLTSYEWVLGNWTLQNAHDETYVPAGQELTNQARKQAYKNAPESVQDEVDALLEPYAPGTKAKDDDKNKKK